MIGAWALELLRVPLFLGGKSPVDTIAAVGFLCSTVVCVITQDVYRRREKLRGCTMLSFRSHGASKSGE
jgi:hypothetical protein